MKTLAKYIFYVLLALAVISQTACKNPLARHGELTAYDPYMKPKFVTVSDFYFSSDGRICDQNNGKIYNFDNYIFEPED